MKKYLPIYLAIVIGSFFGNLIFKNYKTEEVMVSDNNVYMLQYGGYTNEISLNESIKKIKNYNYYTVLINNVYYVLILFIDIDYAFLKYWLCFLCLFILYIVICTS